MSENTEEQIVGTCCYCKQPVKKGEKYHRSPLNKNRIWHESCAKINRAKAFAIAAYLKP